MGKNLDVYINGRLKKRCVFKGIPKQNDGGLYITHHQGFNGYLANVQYFNRAIPFFKIEDLASQNPGQEVLINILGQEPDAVAPHVRTRPICTDQLYRQCVT